MIIRPIVQPTDQFGKHISDLLNSEVNYSRIVFVSAFVALRTILRLRQQLLSHVGNGTKLRLTIGIDLGGTSLDVLEELLSWDCEILIFHNTIARSTFHPKIYLFESEASATIFIGSNNLTDGGFYTNYEAATRYDFSLPVEAEEYARTLRPLTLFLDPQGIIARRLDSNLIAALIARAELFTESEARQHRRNKRRVEIPGTDIPPSPFGPIAIPRPPLLPKRIREEEPEDPQFPGPGKNQPVTTPGLRPRGDLVWKKQLSRSDASQVKKGSHPKALVVLSQAGFENPPGQLIDQTTYFRNLFHDFKWKPEKGKHKDQEHTFVPMRIFIRGQDFGIQTFEISHKPSGEAGQGNSPTSLRWGSEFISTVRAEKLAGTTFSLYETDEETGNFLIDITDV